MISFALAASLLIFCTLAILLVPFWRAAKPKSADALSAAPDQQAAHLAIFRDELDELERELAEGALHSADFLQAKEELQRRLLDEVQENQESQTLAPSTGLQARSMTRKTIGMLLILIPLGALSGYALLGNPQSLAPPTALSEGKDSAKQLENLLTSLEAKVKANPKDSKSWLILARSYKTIGRYAAAVDAFRRVEPLLAQDAALLNDYAYALAQTNNGDFSGQALSLLQQALKLAPDDAQTLFLLGVAANERGDISAVIDYWGRLQVQLEPNSEDEKMLSAALIKLREQLNAGAPLSEKSTPENADSTKSPSTK